MDQVEYIIKKRAIELHRNGECFRKLDLWFFKKHLALLKKTADLEQSIDEIERAAAWNYLLRALGRKAYFCKEIKAKMFQRHVSEANAEYVIAKAKQYAYLDDEREIENGIRFGLARGKGPYRLVLELAHRSGLARDDLENRIALSLSEEELVERGTKLIKRYSLPADRNKAYACLARRGFSNEIIQKVLQWQD